MRRSCSNLMQSVVRQELDETLHDDSLYDPVMVTCVPGPLLRLPSCSCQHCQAFGNTLPPDQKSSPSTKAGETATTVHFRIQAAARHSSIRLGAVQSLETCARVVLLACVFSLTSFHGRPYPTSPSTEPQDLLRSVSSVKAPSP